jgi:hypothetical protein
VASAEPAQARRARVAAAEVERLQRRGAPQRGGDHAPQVTFNVHHRETEAPQNTRQKSSQDVRFLINTSRPQRRRTRVPRACEARFTRACCGNTAQRQPVHQQVLQDDGGCAASRSRADMAAGGGRFGARRSRRGAVKDSRRSAYGQPVCGQLPRMRLS